MAERVREERKPMGSDNPFLALQETISEQIVAGLDAWREMTEAFSERMFLSIYGSPMLQARRHRTDRVAIFAESGKEPVAS
jgi:Protein of unknown function (DUF3141)